jgi:aspartyl/asparaginyl beta-hydroxylase (cupin superfamily)
MNSSTSHAFEAYEKGLTASKKADWQQALIYFATAFKLAPNNVRFAMFIGQALWELERRTEALDIWSLGADRDMALRRAHLMPQADHDTRKASLLADTELRRHYTNLQEKTVRDLEGIDPGRLANAIWPQTHIEQVIFNPNGPCPHMYFAPELPQTPIFDRKEVAWTKTLESETLNIKQEFLALMTRGDVGKPYVNENANMGPDWESLRGQDTWTSIHLYQHGTPTDIAKLCPQTCEVLSRLPVVLHNNNPMEAFFSVLKPGTHIPAHYGLANCRTTVHLPLIIPPDCAIRVGENIHEWAEGETFIFDDSFDHEAWNKSAKQRVVLIFEAWRPDMTDGEIQTVEASYAARDARLKNRKVPDLDALIAAR